MSIKVFRNQEFIEIMMQMVKLFEPHTYVEIGVRNGFTFNRMVSLPEIKRAIAVDVLIHDSVQKPAQNKKIEIYQMDSQDFAAGWKDPIDMLFIDADHRKESVLADFNAMLPFVKDCTGIILLHDTYPAAEYLLGSSYCDNAWEAAQAIHANVDGKYNNIEIFTFPGPYAGMSLARKVPRHLEWWKSDTDIVIKQNIASAMAGPKKRQGGGRKKKNNESTDF